MILPFGQKHGSALVESCLVMILLCLILFGILQVSYLVASKNVINYSAVATARAASVGLNDFMLHKVSRYTSIPTAGPSSIQGGFERNRPDGESSGARWSNAISRKNSPRSALGDYEVSVREAYHLAGVAGYGQILDYDNWQREETTISYAIYKDKKHDDLLHVDVEQKLPLVLPFSRAFFGHLATEKAERNGVVGSYPAKLIQATVIMEDHSALYLGDRDE